MGSASSVRKENVMRIFCTCRFKMRMGMQMRTKLPNTTRTFIEKAHLEVTELISRFTWNVREVVVLLLRPACCCPAPVRIRTVPQRMPMSTACMIGR